MRRPLRAHWEIENDFHREQDVTFLEDNSRIRRRNGAKNFAALRAFAASLLKQGSDRHQHPKKRILAALNYDFRMQALDAARS